MRQFGPPTVLVESLALLVKQGVQGPEAGPQSPISPGILSVETSGKSRVGPPARYRSLTVFPLFCDDSPAVECLLFDEALSAGFTVSEVSAEGSVPELVVENRGDVRILFLEGEELRGAKQNRILNTSVLIPARSTLKIPVSCVESGRWRQTSAQFDTGKTISPSQLRRTLKRSLARSLRQNRGHRSDQHQVWAEVQLLQATLCVASPTMCLADTFTAYSGHLAEGRDRLSYVEGSSGLAVAIGARVVSLDLFSSPAICRKAWDKVLAGLLIDELLEGQAAGSPGAVQVEQLIDEAFHADWTPTRAVGEGEEYWSEFGGKLGAALLLNGTLVHASVIVAA